MMKYFFCLLMTLCAIQLHGREIYVLAVGIADYHYINDLKKTENDARDMAELYRTHTQHVTTLLGAQATHDNILARLRTLCSQATEGDVLVFIFSGHGTKGGLCAYDTRSAQSVVGYGEIQRILQTCPSRNKQLYIDACYSGGLREGKKKKQQDDRPTAETTFTDTQGIMLFLSSRSGETSQENPWSRNGFFTQYLLLGIKGAADQNADRIITAKEIFTYVAQNVAERTNGRQHPVMWGRFNDNMRVMNWNAAKSLP